MSKSGEDGWRKPNLTVEGQKAFWDAQSATYETEEMTTDNQGELDVTLAACREIDCKDIVTLGGAVGCRDPKVILEDMFSQTGAYVPKVVFNDLAHQQVERAKVSILKPFVDHGVAIEFLSGEISSVCGKIANRPRRLIIGVYNCQSFFRADPRAGYPFCGYDEYLRNGRILGEEFLFDWVGLSETRELLSTGVRAKVSTSDEEVTKNAVRDSLAAMQRKVSDGSISSISALQIVGQTDGRDGFFLSHWYTPDGILALVQDVFGSDEFSISVKHFAKGMVLVVDPVGVTPQGVVTVLNNVIGNVLPQSQHETLQAIKRIIT